MAMNLLQGDHAAVRIEAGNFLFAMLGFHEVGIPSIALTIGFTCGP